MRSKRLKVRYEAYRDMRRSDAQDRLRQSGKITLGGGGSRPRPILNPDKRAHLIHQVMEVMRDWRFSPFEAEGSTVAGLRSELCLIGYDWHRSDMQARDVTLDALKRLGARRPTIDEGQREHVERDGVCIWCLGEIDASRSAYGQTGKFCSSDCAQRMRQYRSEEWSNKTSSVARAAAAAIAREKIPHVPCLHCGTPFQPMKMDKRGRKFCSYECVGAHRRMLPEKQCENCTKPFQPVNRYSRFCSKGCAWNASRTLHPRLCENPGCAAMFRPRDQEQKYCCLECRDAVGPEAKHPRVCFWCQRPFMGKHATSKFCNTNCKSTEYQFRTGRKQPKRLTAPVFDYIMREAA